MSRKRLAEDGIAYETRSSRLKAATPVGVASKSPAVESVPTVKSRKSVQWEDKAKAVDTPLQTRALGTIKVNTDTAATPSPSTRATPKQKKHVPDKRQEWIRRVIDSFIPRSWKILDTNIGNIKACNCVLIRFDDKGLNLAVADWTNKNLITFQESELASELAFAVRENKWTEKKVHLEKPLADENEGQLWNLAKTISYVADRASLEERDLDLPSWRSVIDLLLRNREPMSPHLQSFDSFLMDNQTGSRSIGTFSLSEYDGVNVYDDDAKQAEIESRVKESVKILDDFMHLFDKLLPIAYPEKVKMALESIALWGKEASTSKNFTGDLAKHLSEDDGFVNSMRVEVARDKALRKTRNDISYERNKLCKDWTELTGRWLEELRRRRSRWDQRIKSLEASKIA